MEVKAYPLVKSCFRRYPTLSITLGENTQQAHKSLNDPSDITFPRERNDAAGIRHLERDLIMTAPKPCQPAVWSLPLPLAMEQASKPNISCLIIKLLQRYAVWFNITNICKACKDIDAVNTGFTFVEQDKQHDPLNCKY